MTKRRILENEKYKSVTLLNEEYLFEVNGDTISGAALGSLAVKAVIGGATVLGGIALGWLLLQVPSIC